MNQTTISLRTLLQAILPAFVLAFLVCPAEAETLLSNLDKARESAKPSPFAAGNGKAVDFTVGGERPFEVSEVVLRLKLTTDSRPTLQLLEKGTDESTILKPKKKPSKTETTDFVFVVESPFLLWPGSEYRLALSTETEKDEMLWLSGNTPVREDGEAKHSGQAYGQGDPAFWNTPSKVVNLYEIRGQRPDKPVTRPVPEFDGTLISNVHSNQKAAPYTFADGVGRSVDFQLKGDRPFEITFVTLRLGLTPDSRPELVLIGTPRAWADEPVGLNEAAGLGIGGPRRIHARFRSGPLPSEAKETDLVFTPEKPLVVAPGTWRLALTSTVPEDAMKWLVGSNPRGSAGVVTHLRQAYGKGEPVAWDYGRGKYRYQEFRQSGLYSIKGRWRDPEDAPKNDAPTVLEPWKPAEFSGIYPHLAMFNSEEPTECGIGAVVNWADRLWAVTYSPHNGLGSPDKLFRIDPDYRIYAHPESVGGTPANRMIHEESGQLLIGPYLIDRDRRVRVIPPSTMPGRLTGTARHLTDPANKVYYASMEEAFYEVDVRTLEVTRFHSDTRIARSKGFAHGNHGKGLYSGQGRVIYSNNGGSGHSGVRKLNQDFKEIGSLNQWDGKTWEEVHGTGFLDVSGPGGIRGNANPDSDPVWAIGWDYRSVILKVLDARMWHTYRLPKASHTMDGPHGYNTEWPRIGEIGSDTERLIYVHGMFWRLPTAFSTTGAAGLRPRSTYLKMVSDSTRWHDRIVFACNDLSNELQAIRLNPRTIRGTLTPSISHANLWFVRPEQIDDFGVPIGRGSVWMNDTVKANQPSHAYQCVGWDHRLVHLSHGSKRPVRFTIEFDKSGNGKWESWKTVTVPADGYLPLSLDDTPSAEWVRLTTDQNAERVIATFHYANEDDRPASGAPIFNGIAGPKDSDVTGGLVRIKATDGAPLDMVTADGYYEMGTDMKLHRVDDPKAAEALRSIAAIPTGGITADSASVLYIDEEGNRRYRLPRGDVAFDKDGPLGPERIDREVCRERNLLNTYGTLYELPYRNAGGFALIRPVTTHNRRIKDFCSWRGLFAMTGLDLSTKDNGHIIRSTDGQAAVWLGAVDDLWKMGKAVGIGGPWKDTAVKAGAPSDQYLMTGYGQKTLTLSHNSAAPVMITVQVDITGYGNWKRYRKFEVPVGETVTHRFPDDFNAYWVRTVSSVDTTATAQLRYE